MFKATGDAGATAIRLLVQRPIEAVATMPQKLLGLVERIRNRVPEDRLLEAPAEVAGPVIEGIRYLPEGHPLFEMYEALLTRSCDLETRNDANPAFAEIIKTLSPDEARILYWISQQEVRNTRVLRKFARRYKSPSHMAKGLAEFGGEVMCLDIPYWILGNPTLHHAYAYMRHLDHLGIIGDHAVKWYNSGMHRIDVYQAQITAYGQLFCAICIPSTGFTAHDSDFHPSHWEYVNASLVE